MAELHTTLLGRAVWNKDGNEGTIVAIYLHPGDSAKRAGVRCVIEAQDGDSSYLADDDIGGMSHWRLYSETEDTDETGTEPATEE